MTVTPSGRSKTSILRVETSRSSPSAGAERRPAACPATGPTAAASSELPTWCRPLTPQPRPAPRPSGVTQRVRRPGRARPARPSSARTSASGGLADQHHRGRGPRRHRPHPRVVGVEHRHPVRRQRLDQLALGRRDRVDRAELADVRDADVDHHADPRRRDLGTGSVRWPGPRAPISSTRNRVSASARSTVCGRPELVVERARPAPTVGPSRASSCAIRSLVEVLPDEPVIPTIGQLRQPVDHGPGQPRPSRPAGRRPRSSARSRRPGAEHRRPRRRPPRPAAKSCPSTFAPAKATNSPPGADLRGSRTRPAPVTTDGRVAAHERAADRRRDLGQRHRDHAGYLGEPVAPAPPASSTRSSNGGMPAADLLAALVPLAQHARPRRPARPAGPPRRSPPAGRPPRRTSPRPPAALGARAAPRPGSPPGPRCAGCRR